MKRTLCILSLALFLGLGHVSVFAEDVPLSSLTEDDYQGIEDYWGLDNLGSGIVNSLDNLKNKTIEYAVGVTSKVYNSSYNVITKTINKLAETGTNILDYIMYNTVDHKIYIDDELYNKLDTVYNSLFYTMPTPTPRGWALCNPQTKITPYHSRVWISSSRQDYYIIGQNTSPYPTYCTMLTGGGLIFASVGGKSIYPDTVYLYQSRTATDGSWSKSGAVNMQTRFGSTNIYYDTQSSDYNGTYPSVYSSANDALNALANFTPSTEPSWNGDAKPTNLAAPSINPRALYNYNYYTTNQYLIENEDNELEIMDKLTADANKLFPDVKYEDFRVNYNGKENIKDISVNNGNFDFVLDTGNLDNTFVGDISVPTYVITLATMFVVFLILGVVL